jgi:prepilin-type N-terminal cleavage/methylation domain-containing protein
VYSSPEREREGGLVHRSSKSEGGLVHRSSKSEGGFTLVEVLVCTFILTIGMVSTAGLLAVTLQAQQAARESTRSTRLAHDKMDELMKLNFTDARVSIGGNLDANVANHNDTPVPGVTLRWLVAAGPTDDTRVLTVRVTNMRAQQQRRADLTTIIRQW